MKAVIGELMTFPLRVGVRAGRLLVRPAEVAAEHVLTLAGDTLSMFRKRAPSGQPERRPQWPAGAARQPAAGPRRGRADEVAQPPIAPRRRPRSAPPASAAAPRKRELPPLGAEKDHVSEEPIVVAEIAESGAQDGAGAQLKIAEPWSGYTSMNARDIIDRLGSATPAEVALVKLFEDGHRHRRTVLAAAEQALKTASAQTSS